MPPRRTTTRGFTRADSLLSGQIRRASESRGFAQSRVLTQWAEIVGEEIAAIARPVEVGYGRGGMGATLTLLTTGAQAPMLEMQKHRLREKINAVYGYNAISRVRITQTAATGFAEGRVDFAPKRKTAPGPAAPDGALRAEAQSTARVVTDGQLREALARLGENVLTRQRKRGGGTASPAAKHEGETE